MRKAKLASLATITLLLGASLAQAQWGPYPPPYPPQGFPPPQYMPPPYPPGGYPPPYGPRMPMFAGQPYPVPPPPPAARPTPEPPATETPAAEGTIVGSVPYCGPSCSQPSSPAPPPANPVLYDYISDHDRGPCQRFFVSLEALYWWVKPAPSPGPLVTSGSAADPIPGAIGQPGTSVLLGNGNINFPGMSGFRLTVGGWIDNDNKFGVEASGFILENGVNNYFNNSSSVLAVPINVVGPTFPNGQNVVPINSPVAQANPLNAGSANAGVAAVPTTGPYTGSVGVAFASQLWGAEINGYYNLFRQCGWSVDALVGFRFLNLQESTTINASSTDAGTGIVSTWNDRFAAGNDFYGGQIGLRTEYNYCKWTLTGTLKAAFGVNVESLNVSGSSTQTVAGTTTTFPGSGIFAQPSNVGTYHTNAFSFVPSLNVKVAYDLTPNIRLFAGYDFLYWTNVIRGTNQIDGTINPSQTYGGTLVGPANPAPMFNQSNFYAQGVSAGLMFRY